MPLAWYFDDALQKWDVLEMEVQLAKEAFAVGSMRSAFKLHVKSKDKNAKCVAAGVCAVRPPTPCQKSAVCKGVQTGCQSSASQCDA